MKIIYGKELTAEEKILCQNIAFECGILYDTARLLLYRGIDTVKKAKAFINADKRGFYDPFRLSGMKEAVARIKKAKENGENVLIFGDYDADGICATTVLYYCLKDFGINARTVIPEREDGYGLNIKKITDLNEQSKIDLLISVDCGISDCEKIEEIKGIGIEVIVTDHHEPPSVLPNCVKINPKLNGQDYPFNGLCGAGVAYKLGRALIGKDADKYLDFTALATVADSMDLVDENRCIVVEGLKLFNSKNLREQFKVMLGDNNRSVTAQTLAYTIAPRINAGGRMGDADLALRLFLSDNKADIFDFTAKLGEYNLQRQVECDNIYKEAKALVLQKGLETDEIILVENSEWRTGFIGIVAAKLVEDYGKPVIVFAGYEDGCLKGSARSVDDINIYDAICYAEDLLVGFGGHSQAAGVSVKTENLQPLRDRLNAFVKSNFGTRDKEKKVYAEWNIEGEISLRFAREIDLLEPFGVGNKKPLFTTTVKEIQSNPLKAGSPHYTFKTPTIEMLDFNGGNDVFELSLPIEKRVVFEVNLSVFKNKEYLKGYVKNVVADYKDFSELNAFVIANELEKLKTDNIGQVEQVDRQSLKSSLGTVFALSDAKNLISYPELKNLPIKLFSTDEKNNQPCVVVSIKEIKGGYDKIVYLDRPVATLKTRLTSQILGDTCGYSFVNGLSVDRSDFSQAFIKFKDLAGKRFNSVAEFSTKYKGELTLEQTVFTLTVFLELGIFYVKNGVFLFDSRVKNPLTNSKVYSKIYLLKNS